MKKQVATILGIVLVILIAIFALINLETVQVSFGFASVKMPLILLMLVCLLFGALIIFLFSTTANVQKNREYRKLQSQSNQKQSELKIEIQNLQNSMDSLQNKLKNSAGKQALGLKDQQIENLEKQISDLSSDLNSSSKDEKK